LHFKLLNILKNEIWDFTIMLCNSHHLNTKTLHAFGQSLLAVIKGIKFLRIQALGERMLDKLLIKRPKLKRKI